jgi:N4-gp56 family major capsid protein
MAPWTYGTGNPGSGTGPNGLPAGAGQTAGVNTSIPELWAKQTLRDMKRAGFWGRFVGSEASGAAIIQKDDLLNNPGDTVHIEITGALTGAGVTDETLLIGAEEGLSTTEMVVIPTYYRHGVVTKRRAAKKSIVDLRSEASMRLLEWGQQKLDSLRFSQFTISQNSVLSGHTLDTNPYYAWTRVTGTTGTTALAQRTQTVASGLIDVTKPLTVQEIQAATLSMYNNNAIPITIDGEQVWVLVAHPNTLYTLKRDSEYRDWVQQAAIRGADNPFFKGATAMVDGCVIFTHSSVPTSTTGSPGSAQYAKNLMFGAEAFIEGLDENPTWNEEVTDYGAQFGVAYGFAIESRRALEKQSLQLYAPAVAV